MYGNNRGMDYSSQYGASSSMPYSMDLSGYGTSGDNEGYGSSIMQDTSFSSFPSGNGQAGGIKYFGGPQGSFHNGPGKSMGGNYGSSGVQRGGNRGGSAGRGMGRGATGGTARGAARGADKQCWRVRVALKQYVWAQWCLALLRRMPRLRTS